MIPETSNATQYENALVYWTQTNQGLHNNEWIPFGIHNSWKVVIGGRPVDRENHDFKIEYCKYVNGVATEFKKGEFYVKDVNMDTILPFAHFDCLFALFKTPTARNVGYRSVIEEYIKRDRWPRDHQDSIPCDVLKFMQTQRMTTAIHNKRPKLTIKTIHSNGQQGNGYTFKEFWHLVHTNQYIDVRRCRPEWVAEMQAIKMNRPIVPQQPEDGPEPDYLQHLKREIFEVGGYRAFTKPNPYEVENTEARVLNPEEDEILEEESDKELFLAETNPASRTSNSRHPDSGEDFALKKALEDAFQSQTEPQAEASASQEKSATSTPSDTVGGEDIDLEELVEEEFLLHPETEFEVEAARLRKEAATPRPAHVIDEISETTKSKEKSARKSSPADLRNRSLVKPRVHGTKRGLKDMDHDDAQNNDPAGVAVDNLILIVKQSLNIKVPTMIKQKFETQIDILTSKLKSSFLGNLVSSETRTPDRKRQKTVQKGTSTSHRESLREAAIKSLEFEGNTFHRIDSADNDVIFKDGWVHKVNGGQVFEWGEPGEPIWNIRHSKYIYKAGSVTMEDFKGMPNVDGQLSFEHTETQILVGDIEHVLMEVKWWC